ncbi:MAG: S9 family peptidase [Planctomycetes bacterium]|nr:S9 family peptidase [Planctomycetota bacterium]
MTNHLKRPGFRSTKLPVEVPVLVVFAVVLLGAAPAPAKELFTADHVAKLRSVSTAKVSPDGRHIAYVLSVPRRPYKDENGPSWSQLHVIGPDGTSRPYITGEGNVGAIQWTPDGHGISFLAKRGKDKHRALYVIPLSGGEARKILSHKTDITSYSFNPDGSRVAFLAKEKAPKQKKKLKKKGFDAEIFEEELRFTRVWIGVPDADEDAKAKVLELEGNASELHWSPTGSELTVALAPTPLIDDHYMKRKLHIVDADTGNIISRINNPGKLGRVAWSPDGQHLALLAAADLHDPSPGRLMVVPRVDGALQDILPDYKGHVSSIAWGDDETVVFLGDEGVWTTLGEVRIDGSGRKTRIPAGRQVLSGLTLSRGGTTAVMLGQTPRHPSEVFVMHQGDAGAKRLSDSNPWLDDMQFAKQEAIAYEARDGLKIEGILIRPLNEEPGKRYPLILTVHGGPEGHYRNGWVTRYSSPGQVGAAQGYAVFYPNYRASTGRGVAFSKLNHGDPAGKEFDDLVDGVDHLIHVGLVDRNRVGVTGGSYGGFATAWCSTYYSERFAAGVMFVGLSDLIAKVGTTDIPNEMTLVHWRKNLWDDWEFFLTRSPIYYVQKARTPLLILGGKKDRRVHPSQSMELFRHLKTLGQTPVRLVRYPGEGHGNRKAGARYDYSLRIMRWFNHYLKGPGGDPPAYELDYGFDTSKEDEDDSDDVEE